MNATRKRRLPHQLMALLLLMVVSNVQADPYGTDKKFEARKHAVMRQIERRLTTRRGDDEEKWYVLMFHDQAAKAEFRRHSPTGRSGYWDYDVARSDSMKKVQGRTAAAEAVFQFLMRSPESLHGLPPSAFDQLVRWQKAWDFHAFRSAKEAQAFYLSLQRPKDLPSRGR